MKTLKLTLRITLLMAATVLAARAQVRLSDNFDGYANQAAFEAAWTTTPLTVPVPMVLTTTNRSISGAKSIYQSTGTNQSYRAIPSPYVYTTNFYFRFWFYDGGTALGRTYGMVYGYNGGSTPPTTPNQIIAIGKYNSTSTTKYSGRCYTTTIGGSTNYNSGAFFVLDAGTSPDRTIGWHLAEVIGKSDNSVEYRVDGLTGKIIPGNINIGNGRINYVVMGSGLTTATDIWFDDIHVESLLPPVITNQPTSVVVDAGESATFTVGGEDAVSATNALTYQWQFNGVNISGATGSSYTRVNAQQATAGDYTVLVKDRFGSQTTESDIATLTVVDGEPNVVTPPQSVTTNAGNSVLFSVVTTGTDPRSYQWRHAGTNISATATATSYTRANVQQATAGNYSVVVSNLYGMTTSAVAVLTVIDTLPMITVQPTNQTVAAGSNVVFRVTTTGTDPRTYQWSFAGTNISGATATSYTRSNAQTNHSGNYQVVITNALGSATSVVAVLTVTNTGPIIITQPTASRTAPAGSNVVFSVTTWGTDPRYWQWYFGGSPISGATASSYTRSNAQTNHSGNYQVVISNSLNVVTSALAVLTIYNTNPVLSTQPTSRTVNAGSNVLFTVVSVYGSDPRSYQWRFEGGDIAGATGTSYTRTNAQSADAGNYSVVVTNEFSALYGGPTTSTNAVLTVSNIAPVITTQPQSQTKNVGESVTFTVVATGTTPMSYQWKFYGSNIISSPNASSYTRSGLQPADAGNYSVEVSNSLGSTLSSNAVLTVLVPAPVIQMPVLSGTNLTLTWSSIAGRSYQVQYKTNLNQVGWLVLTTLTAGGSSTAVVTSAAPARERYYQVALLP